MPATGLFRSGWPRRSRAGSRGAGGMSSSSASAKAAASGCARTAVVAALEADRRERITREASAADRAPVVARIDENVVGQLEQTLDRPVEVFRRRLGPAAGVEVRTTDVANEQRVAGEYKPRLFRPSAPVCDKVGVVRRCVARCGDCSHDGVPELDDFAIGERNMLEIDGRSGRQVCHCPGRLDERRAAPRHGLPGHGSRRRR